MNTPGELASRVDDITITEQDEKCSLAKNQPIGANR